MTSIRSLTWANDTSLLLGTIDGQLYLYNLSTDSSIGLKTESESLEGSITTIRALCK